MEINSDKSNELEKRYKNFNPKLNFVVVSQMLARDKRLSWKARGVFLYLATNNHKWKFRKSELLNHSEKDGYTSTSSALNELIHYGYLKIESCRKRGQFSNRWTLYYVPRSINRVGKPVTDNTETAKSVADDSVTVKPTSNKYQKNKHQRNKYQSLVTSNNNSDDITSKSNDKLTDKQKRNELYKKLNDKQRTLLFDIHKKFGTDTYNYKILKDVVKFSKYPTSLINWCLQNVYSNIEYTRGDKRGLDVQIGLRKNPFYCNKGMANGTNYGLYGALKLHKILSSHNLDNTHDSKYNRDAEKEFFKDDDKYNE